MPLLKPEYKDMHEILSGIIQVLHFPNHEIICADHLCNGILWLLYSDSIEKVC